MEMGNRKFFWFAILFQNLMAYCVALVVYQLVGLAIGEVAQRIYSRSTGSTGSAAVPAVPSGSQQEESF